LGVRVESEERLRPDGDPAAGRSSANPATARKAEKEKRSKRARRNKAGVADPGFSGGFGAFVDHVTAYTVAEENWQDYKVAFILAAPSRS
jgi:hypothetical protein